MAAILWVRLMKKTRILRDLTVPCAKEDWQEALGEACKQLDLSRPVLLRKHERDWEEFSQAHFLRGDFLEDVPFDRMEVEWTDPDAKKIINPEYL